MAFKFFTKFRVKLVCFSLISDIEVGSMSVDRMRDKPRFCSVLSYPDPIVQPSVAQRKVNMVK